MKEVFMIGAFKCVSYRRPGGSVVTYPASTSPCTAELFSELHKHCQKCLGVYTNGGVNETRSCLGHWRGGCRGEVRERWHAAN